ncbi:hypothetical protein Goari_008807, partial [Gossypium aridum]|nr:hypothetical protein [Gossypium aridum]
MQHPDKKAVENGHPISVFLNSITEIENGLWRLPTPTIRIGHFQSFQRPSSTENKSPSARIPSTAITCAAPFPSLTMNWNRQHWNFLARFFASQ